MTENDALVPTAESKYLPDQSLYSKGPRQLPILISPETIVGRLLLQVRPLHV